jgi:hypothetical protein
MSQITPDRSLISERAFGMIIATKETLQVIWGEYGFW